MSTVNMLKTAVSAVASSGLGAFTIGSAVSGFRTFGSGHDGQKFTVMVSEGSSWEIRAGAIYTHSGTTLSRGTLEDSSTGAAIAFTSACVLHVVLSAGDIERLSGVVIHITADRDLTDADDGATLVWDNEYTVTLPEGLRPAFSFLGIPPDSGDASIAVSGDATLNGGTDTITRSGANPFSVIAKGTDAYIAPDNAVSPLTTDSLTALISALPTSLPGSSGVLWLNGGVLSIS